MRTAQTCTSESRPTEPSVNEMQLICGIGASEHPVCNLAALGSSDTRAEWSQHSRMRIACNGNVEWWHWQLPDYQTVYHSHWQTLLSFP